MKAGDGWPPPWGRSLAAYLRGRRDEERSGDGELVFRVGDMVEIDTAAQRYRGEWGEVTGLRQQGASPGNGEVYVKLTGVRRPIPFGAGELKLRSSLARAREAKGGR